MTNSEIKAVLDHSRETAKKLAELRKAMATERTLASIEIDNAYLTKDIDAHSSAAKKFVSANAMVVEIYDVLQATENMLKTAEERRIGQ